MVGIGNDDADGPTRITGTSMFGLQVLSQRHTAAAYGFGSSTRAHASKLFIGGEHAKLSSAQNSDTPGPHYATLGSVGTQAEGGKPSPPTWKLGKADRFVHDRYAARFQGASPDELSLVVFAARCGLVLHERTPTRIVVQEIPDSLRFPEMARDGPR